MKRFNPVIAAAIVSICSTFVPPPGQCTTTMYQKEMTRGNYQMTKKDYQSAVASFTQVLMIDPNVAEAYLNRAISREELKDREGALSDLDQAIKINPNVVECYVRRGDLRAKQGDMPEAIADYTQALRLNPRSAEGFLNRARAYKLNGEYTKAAGDYTAALNFQETLEAMAERADCRAKAGDIDGAIDDYNVLLKKFSASGQHLHFNLAEVLVLKGDKAGAKTHLDQVITLYSKNLKRTRKSGLDYMQRGLAYDMLDQKDKALADFEEAQAWAPDNADIRYHLGRLRLGKGDFKGAVMAFDEALRLNPKYSAARMGRAEANVGQGDFVAAQKDLDVALTGEKSAEAYMSRAIARLAIGDSSGAVSDIQEAKLMNPKVLDTKKAQLAETVKSQESEKGMALAQNLEQLALLELADNNLEKAESLLNETIAIEQKHLSKTDPKIPLTMMMLGRVQLKKKRPIVAMPIFERCLKQLRKDKHEAYLKYALFNLEDCAKTFIQASEPENAGAILVNTRMMRAESALNERAFSGELARKADRAIEKYKEQKRLAEKQLQQQSEEVASLPDEQPVNVTASTPQYTTLRTPASRRSESAPAEEAPPAQETKRKIERPIRDKWAVVVGISNFQNSTINLRYCSKDAKDFADFLVKDKNFAPDHVQLLTDELATRANILNLLGGKWLPHAAEPDDLVVVYFSTHGSPSNFDEGGINYLIAHDTDIDNLYGTGINMQDLSGIIKNRVHCDRVMIVLDACHSGSAAPSSKGLNRPKNVNVDDIVQGTGQLVLSSSTPEQRSWESKRYEGSVFTKYLIDGLKQNGPLTRLGEAFTYLNQQVQSEVLRDRGEMQNPVMKSKWEGTDLIIGVEPKAPSKTAPVIELGGKPAAPHKAADKDLPKPGKSAGEKPKASTTRRAR